MTSFPISFSSTTSNDHENKSIPISKQIKQDGRFSGLFPGWGESRVIGCLTDDKYAFSIAADTDKHYKPKTSVPQESLSSDPHHGLNLLFSLSIGGNDILSSCLYTAGIVASYAGKIAPLSLSLVAFVLFFYRNIYAEVVTAIPVNGGNYNAVLNVSSKKSAAVVSCLSLLSYVATAIISAFSANLYLKILWPDLDLMIGTIVILVVFAAITLCGVGESASVSMMIFVFHTAVLCLLIIWGFAYGIRDNFEIFNDNMQTDYPSIMTSSGSTLGKNNVGLAIFCGYSIGMLGITGSETPANYVEDMNDSSVLLGTINWMWILSILNPLLSIVSMMVMEMDFIYEHPGDLLAVMADILGGPGAKILVVVDAIIVLCGAVLTAYVGVSSLLKTLATDGILPSFLVMTNRRNAPYMAIVTFCTFAILLFILVFSPHNPSDIGSFGGVFAIAFLCVLLSFIYANLLLKLYRRNLGRLVIAEWWEVFFCLGCLVAALLGNLILTPDVFSLFVIYLSGCLVVVILMFARVYIYSYSIWALRNVEIDFEKMKEATNHAKAIRKAARLREKYTLKKEFFDDNSDEPLIEEEPDVPQKVTSRHTVGNVMDLISQKKQSKAAIEEFLTPTVHRPVKSDRIPELTTQSNKLDEFLAKREGKEKNVVIDEEEGEKKVEMTPLEDLDDPEEATNPNDILPPILYHWIGNVMENLYPTATSEGHLPQSEDDYDSARIRAGTLDKLDRMMYTSTLKFKCLEFFMESLENIVITPIVYLCKGLDPIAINLALEYVAQNELTSNIIVLHVVDDRKAINSHHKILKRLCDLGMEPALLKNYHRKLLIQHLTGDLKEKLKSNSIEKKKTALSVTDIHDIEYDLEEILNNLPEDIKSLPKLVSLFDTLYMSKRLSCVILRGTVFCPSAIKWVSQYLNVPLTNFIMGMPGLDFPIPLSKFCGVRIAVPETDAGMRLSASRRLEHVLKQMNDHHTTSTPPHLQQEFRSIITSSSPSSACHAPPPPSSIGNPSELNLQRI